MKYAILKYMKKGFTLIEVLIVVSIIGLLASVILVGLGGFRARGRDARRVADLRQAQNGLELYYTKFGVYPDSTTWQTLGGALISAGIGVNAVPNDPTANWNYGYCRFNTDSYVVAAYSEDIGNPNLKQYPQATTFPCDPVLSGTPGNPSCSKEGTVTNKFCLIF